MDFAPMAARYDELRPASLDLAELTLAALVGSRRLLDVGCGTGRFAALAADRLGARVWGIDPSPEMLAQARARGARGCGWKQATADRLPFKEGWFDAVHAHLVLHLVESRDRAVAEMVRVLGWGGRMVIVSFRPEHFDRFHLAPYFPSMVEIDRARFPDPDLVVGELRRAGLDHVSERAVRRRVRLEPADVLARVRGRYISTLHLLDEREYQSGLEQLERDLSARATAVESELVWSLTVGRRPAKPNTDLSGS
jgi:ubiquinone/menaquinone biosynthesis C-methylase UbiE